MSLPITPPAGRRLPLGTDGGDTFFAVDGEVYRERGPYCWSYCTLACWPQQSVARRIAGRTEATAAEQRKVRAAIEAERALNRRR